MVVNKQLYFAYGSNLCKKQMADRCPESKYLISGVLANYSWLINTRGYASINPSKGDFVLGEIFSLSGQDIDFLDIYENVAEGMYCKETLSIQTKDGALDCLVYIASDQEKGEPQTEYITRINAGIKSASLPDDYVRKCIRPYVPENT